MSISFEEKKDVIILKIHHIESQELEEGFNRFLGSGKNKIICDMKQLQTIDPKAQKVFSDSIKKAREQGGDIKLCQVAPAVKKIFDFVSFKEKDVFYKSVEEGCKNINLYTPAATLAPKEEFEPTIVSKKGGSECLHTIVSKNNPTGQALHTFVMPSSPKIEEEEEVDSSWLEETTEQKAPKKKRQITIPITINVTITLPEEANEKDVKIKVEPVIV